jgi:tetratricopeptide (TPR) repeat protein
MSVGCFAEAETDLLRARAYYRSFGKLSGEVGALRRLGSVAVNRGDMDEGHRRYREALDLARSGDSEWALSEALTGMGSLELDRGRYREAIDLLLEAYELQAKEGKSESSLLGLLGHAYADVGEYDEAIRYSEQLLEMWRHSGDANGRVTALMNLGRFNRFRGRYDDSLVQLREALGEAHLVGLQLFVRPLLHELAELFAAIGEAQTAVRLAAAEHAIDEDYVNDPGHCESCAGFLDRLRDVIGDEAYDRAWAEGFAMPAADAVNLALSVGERSDAATPQQLT